MRHGLTTGWRNPGLLPEGRTQARRAADRVACLDAANLVVSPLRRCLETAAPFHRLALPSRLDSDFMERGWGTLEGRPREWRSNAELVAEAGAEPWDTFRARVAEGLARLSGRPVVVAHSGVFRVLALLLGIEDRPPIPNGAVMIIQRRAGACWRIDDRTF